MRTVACAASVVASLVLTALGVSTAHAATVPVDALGPLGDEHVIYPPYASPIADAATATADDAGDVNGDGIDDSAVLIHSWDPTYGSSAWITYSPTTLPGTVVAGQPGWSGMHITGGRYWFQIAGVGDVNGDGLGDVAVQTYGTENQNYDGDIVVVFGRTTTETIDVTNLGDDGFRIKNVLYGVAQGFGYAYVNTSVRSAGDQNGDGRDDLAFRDGDTVKVAYTPADPAGATVDAGQLGSSGFTLATGADTPHVADYVDGPFVDTLGDLNGDGREDLAVSWTDSSDRLAHGVGVLSPEGGTTVDLNQVVEAGTGFEFQIPDSVMENAITIGDQNGDGHRDLGLVTAGVEADRPRSLTIGYAPELGVRRTILPTQPGVSESFGLYDGHVLDVGDQDADGIADVGFVNVVRFSSSGEVKPVNPAGPGGALYLIVDSTIVGSVADRNSDGKRELMTMRADPYKWDPPSTAAFMLDIFLSAEPPVPGPIDLPLDTGDGLDFTGTFVTARHGGTRTLAARASVELTDPKGGMRTFASSKLIDANHRRTEAKVTVSPDAAGLVPGRKYGYRMVLENGRGLTARSARRSFVYRLGFKLVGGTPGADRLFGGVERDDVRGRGGADLLRAGGGADILNGGDGDDRAHAGRGADVVIGGRGRDRLYGGRGADLVKARDGRRDRIGCGAGHDRVEADALDVVTGCEVVERG